MQRTDRPCQHNADLGCDYPCIACDPTPDDPKLRSIGFGFAGGQKHWHDGQTNREWEHEMVTNARANGIEPEYLGSRSARIPNSVLA